MDEIKITRIEPGQIPDIIRYRDPAASAEFFYFIRIGGGEPGLQNVVFRFFGFRGRINIYRLNTLELKILLGHNIFPQG